MSRFVIIDDTDPSIQYSGPWFEVNDTQLEIGENGPPFNNTSHGVNTNANFSFNFSGSAVVVYGTSVVTINAAGTQDPTWECFVDNTSIGISPPSSVALNGSMENNWVICSAQLQDGPHLLTVNANVANQQTFWFDKIYYAPSADVSLDQLPLRIDSSDSAIQYSRGLWRIQGDPINYTSPLEMGLVNLSTTRANGAFLTYEFSGTSISLFGSNQFLNLSIANATYTIDDQEPFTFSVGGTTTVFNQLIFEAGQLSPGQHKLLVTYLGTNTSITTNNFTMQQPLIISYFVQQDGTSFISSNTPGSTSTGDSSAGSTPTSVPSGLPFNSSPVNGKPTDAIIGGVIGGLVLVSLLIALFFLYRRKNRRSNAPGQMSYAVPSPDVVNPFTVPPSIPTSTFQPQRFISNGQSFPSQTISSKFSHRNQPSDPASMSSYSSGGSSPVVLLTPLRRQPGFSSPTFISPSSESPRPPLTGSQTNFVSARPRFPQSATRTDLPIQQSPSSQRDDARFLWHEDSGVRIPPAENRVVEFPPIYSPG